MLNLILLYLVYLFHIFIMLLVTLGPFLIKNTNILLLIISINIFVVTGWYLYGYCFFTDIEKLLSASEENSKETRSFITILSQEYLPDSFNNYIHIFFSIIPLLSTFICCLTIYFEINYSSCNKLSNFTRHKK